ADTDVGSVTVSVRATDPHGAFAQQTFIINVANTNDAPVAVADSNNVTEDAVLSVSGNLLTNDSDGDANVVQGLTVPVLQGGTDGGATLTRIGAHGTLVITKATGAYTYTLDNAAAQSLQLGQSVTDTFTYRANDGLVNSNAATLVITVHGTNDGPIATA